MSLNKVILIGNLGKDPELRKTKTGKSVANFSIATYEKQGEEKITQWHNIVAWEKTADNCAKYLAKGRQVYVEGKLQTSTYETDSGEKRMKVEVVAHNVVFLAGRDKSTENKKDDDAPSKGRPASGNNSYDDLPF